MQYGHHELSHISDIINPKAYIAFEEFKGDLFGSVQGAIFGDTCQSLLFGSSGAFSGIAAETEAYKNYVHLFFHEV